MEKEKLNVSESRNRFQNRNQANKENFNSFIVKCSMKKIYASYNTQKEELLLYRNPEWSYIASKKTLERHRKTSNLRKISSVELRKNKVLEIPVNVLKLNENEIMEILEDSFDGIDNLYIGEDEPVEIIENNDNMDIHSAFQQFEQETQIKK